RPMSSSIQAKPELIPLRLISNLSPSQARGSRCIITLHGYYARISPVYDPVLFSPLKQIGRFVVTVLGRYNGKSGQKGKSCQSELKARLPLRNNDPGTPRGIQGAHSAIKAAKS